MTALSPQPTTTRFSSLITKDRVYAPRCSLPVLELAVILLIELVYISLITPPPTIARVTDHIDLLPLEQTLLDPNIRQSGLEHERLAGVLLPVKIGLETFGRIPTWNPYITDGEPIINNAFSYLFNPFHSLPVWLLGGVQGTKLAMFIALFIAGFSMWALARALGLGAVARVTTAALYMLSGSIMGKYNAGHFQLALSLSWPPLVFATLWWTLHNRARLAPVSFGIAFALLFFAGNIYYVLHTLVCVFFIVIVHLVKRTRDENRWRLRWDRLRRIALAGAFAFGLAALQFFPVWQVRDYVDHNNQPINANGSLEGSYNMEQAVTNLIYPYPAWTTFEVLSNAQLVAVDYAYIGSAPFLLIALAFIILLIYSSRQQKSGDWRLATDNYSLLFLLLALLMMVWGAGQTPILQWLYAHIPLLDEFRFLGRALAIAALWWIVLAGIALDLLWKAARDFFSTPPAFISYNRLRLLRAMFLALLVWGYFLLYSVANTSTRQVMVLYNFRWLNSLDEHRFTSFSQAANALFSLILIAAILDTVLLVLERTFRPRIARERGVGWQALATRIAHILLLGIASAAILDVMLVNSALLDFQPAPSQLTAIYTDLHQLDSNPFPAVNEAFSPSTFTGYEMGVRRWGLDEGWSPWSPLGVIPNLGTITDLPRWAIVSNVYGGASQVDAQRFVDYNGYLVKKCYALAPTISTTDPCLMDVDHTAAVLYEKPDVLPYAFVVSAEHLLNDPASLNASNVMPAQVVSDQMDIITLQANMPDSTQDYLIVEETNFPGWQVTIDGIPAEVTTAQTALSGIHNRGFIAVAMLPGDHTYTLYFEPPGFRTGLIIFIVTLLGIAFYLTRRWRNRIASSP